MLVIDVGRNDEHWPQFEIDGRLQIPASDVPARVDALRAGHVDDASGFFSVPTVVQNGTPPLQLTDRRQIESFNNSLPCGARLTAAIESGKYTIATFKLTERPGIGHCGNGVGEQAKTAFVIQNGLITQWRRVVDAGEGAPANQGPVV